MGFENNGRKKGRYNKEYSRQSQRIFTKPFSDEGVDRLRRLLQTQSPESEKRFFAIKVDGEFCILKTNNVRSFNDYKQFVDGETQTIEVILYYGQSNNCNRHLFYLKGNGLVGAVNPLDVDRKIEEALAKKDQDYLIQSLKQKVEEQEELIEQLEDELAELRQKTDFRGLIQEGMALVGAFRGGNATPLAGPDDKEAEVEVEAHQDEASDELDEQQQTFEKIYNKYGKEAVDKVTKLVVIISKSKRVREGINKLLKEESERDSNTEETK